MTDTIEEIRARHEADANMYRDRRHDSAHADRATLLRALGAMVEENARMKEAFSGPAAWLDSWAQHVGNCKGGDVCTCGLTLARTEACGVLIEPGQ